MVDAFDMSKGDQHMWKRWEMGGVTLEEVVDVKMTVKIEMNKKDKRVRLSKKMRGRVDEDEKKGE